MNLSDNIKDLERKYTTLGGAIVALKEVQRSEGGTPISVTKAAPATTVATAPRKRKLSPAARKRIAEGQRKRWAAAKRIEAPTVAAPVRGKRAAAAGARG